LTTKQFLKLIGAGPGNQLAHGYTFDRVTVDIEVSIDGEIERWEDDKLVEKMGKEFNHTMITRSIKRFYRERTNSRMIELFGAFGNPLLVTP
jgi:hypothetical protein